MKDQPYQTSDISFAAIAAIFELEVNPDLNDPFHATFAITPSDKAKDLAKDYLYFREGFKEQIFDAQRKAREGRDD